MKLKCFTLYGIFLVYMIYFLSALCKLGETSLTLLNLYEAREYCNRFGKELSLNVDDVSNQTFPVWINAVKQIHDEWMADMEEIPGKLYTKYSTYVSHAKLIHYAHLLAVVN